MKIDEDTRFPHPVLSEDTADYASGAFDIAFGSVAEGANNGEVILEYKVTLTEPSIQRLVADGHAAAGVFTTCLDTYFSQLIRLGLGDSRLTFEPGTVSGRVVIRPMIWATRNISGFSLANCDAEFGGGSTEFDAGAVLALGKEIVVNVGREKMAQMESIFKLAKSDKLTGSTLSVELDSDRVRILIAADTYDNVNRLRGLGHGRPIILNSVYLPAVMEVLNSLGEASAIYEGKRWYKVFSAKCDHLGIDVENPDLWKDAQKLLASPYGEIRNNKEISGT